MESNTSRKKATCLNRQKGQPGKLLKIWLKAGISLDLYSVPIHTNVCFPRAQWRQRIVRDGKFAIPNWVSIFESTFRFLFYRRKKTNVNWGSAFFMPCKAVWLVAVLHIVACWAFELELELELELSLETVPNNHQPIVTSFAMDLIECLIHWNSSETLCNGREKNKRAVIDLFPNGWGAGAIASAILIYSFHCSKTIMSLSLTT